MDTPNLEKHYLTAGHEYVEALQNLGMQITAAVWGYDKVVERHVLVLITDFFDLKGPLEISERLFMAYNASATPKEIDPFSVRLHSAEQPVGEFCAVFAGGMRMGRVDQATKKPTDDGRLIEKIEYDGVELRSEWVIFSRKIKKRTAIDVGRNWDRFSSNIKRLAA